MRRIDQTGEVQYGGGGGGQQRSSSSRRQQQQQQQQSSRHYSHNQRSSSSSNAIPRQQEEPYSVNSILDDDNYHTTPRRSGGGGGRRSGGGRHVADAPAVNDHRQHSRPSGQSSTATPNSSRRHMQQQQQKKQHKQSSQKNRMMDNNATYDSARGRPMLDQEPNSYGGASEYEEDYDYNDEDFDYDDTDDSSEHDGESTVEPSFFIIPPRDGGVGAASVASSRTGGSTASAWRQRRRFGGASGGSVMSGNVGSKARGNGEPTSAPCRPYRRDKLNFQIDLANDRGGPGHASVLKTLKNYGVMIYIVDSKTSGSVADVMDSVTNIIFHICKESKNDTMVGSCPVREGGRRMQMIQDQKEMLGLEDPEEDELTFCDKLCGPPGGKMDPKVAFHHETVGSQQRCLLYRDPDGRLFNLTLAPHTTAVEGTWKSLLQSFSVLQAVTLLVVLCRSFSCAMEDNDVPSVNFAPAYLTLVLGLVFSEEISLSWVNVAMFVRGFPSISAYSVISKVGSDWLRKAMILCLAIAASSDPYGKSRKVFTLLGLTMACCILLANLGARSWKFLGWKPSLASTYFGNCTGNAVVGIIEPIIAYFMAIMAGIVFPYLGHREVKVGGTVAVESIIRIAIVVAGLFILSGYDEVQKFLVVGSEDCDQRSVNVAVGAWWCFSLLACLVFARGRKVSEFWPEYNEPILKEDQSSPVGFRVPHLPDYPFDPTYSSRESLCFNLQGEFILGSLLALGVGGAIIYTGLGEASFQ
mmetsp:Transcript_25420/g.60086  ORF Transcript_25420/g.60086 Transcript_25420/m.60086 type:complete len:752 (-) Transcript_25420:181-2436(-)